MPRDLTSASRDDADTERGESPEEQNGKSEQKPEDRAVGFFDPAIREVRNLVLMRWSITTVTLMFYIMGVLCLYWASLFSAPQNLKHLKVWVVDFDGSDSASSQQAIVGPAITKLAAQMLDMPSHLGFISKSPSDFNHDPKAVWQSVYDFKAYAAIIVNSNATSMLMSAIQNSNSSYEPLGACQMVYITARDDTTYSNYIMPMLDSFVTEATTSFGMKWTQMVTKNITQEAVQKAVQAVPQALNPGIGFSRYDLRPFYNPVMTPVVSVGLIYLIIISFLGVSFFMPVNLHFMTPKPKGNPRLKPFHIILWRYLSINFAYFLLSLTYSLVSLAFKVNFYEGPSFQLETWPMERGNAPAYGHGTFFVYWMLNFVGMMALGLTCENVAMLVGMPWMGLFLILWVITNVSTSFYNMDIEPGFFKWGYAWPLQNIVEGSRSTLFDLHSRLGLNFGVLAAWIGFNTVMFPLMSLFMKWKKDRKVTEFFTPE